ncbi:extracellular_matrix protein [Hexamita inflata]|uniref:Extracellular matrix protein n=1 Tax=Hexamita inflata TaxID=28002 RepID=A0AA86NDQ4_9EUKA|nr:extracellular matrix protein [Hexamita inflata]
MDYCESLFSGRLWLPLKSCSLSSALNPNSQIVDSSIINVLQFAPSSDQSYFSVLSLQQSGSIQNAIILVNASLSSNQNQLFVSIFNQLSGKLNNVTLTGFVNISAPLETEINFSPFGTVNGDLINYPENWIGDFTFKNVSNNLKLFVNGIEISITGGKIKVNKDVNTSNNNFNIGGVEHKSVLIKNKIINENHSKVIYFGFKIIEGNNNNTNALMDLYLIPHKISIEKYYEINSLKVYNFNTDGTLASQKADFTIYIQNTKAVADRDSKIKICSGKYIYDIKTKLCISKEQCHSQPNQLIFQSTCAIQCPDKYVVFNKTCYSQCPQWLGAYQDSSSGLCAQCPSNQLATESGCVQSCSSFAFKYGCYQNCPAGTVVQGKTCTEPSSISECGSGEYLVLTGMLDGQRFYNTCETTGPSWMYRLVDQNDVQTNVYKAECRGLILPNNDCQELGSPSEITNSGWCEEQCEIGEYFQPELQICHECLSDIYDGGLYFERNGLKCVSSCSKWSLSGTKKICEDKFPNNCPVWQVISAGQFQCQTSCSSSQFQDGQVCSSCDPALNKQVDKDSGGCLCKSGYFTLNMPDGSFTCTECDTTLNFKPSKEGSICKCLDNAVYQDNKCIILCTSTQVILPGATSCSTCPQNTIPNVAKDGCVEKTGCAPGFLNVAGTFCVSSCASDSSIDGPSNQCVSCASKDPLTQFSSGQCVCVPGASKATSSASCACNQNFSPASGACSCSKKLSSDGQTCSDKCPAAEVSINGNTQCSTCASDFIPDEQQLECKKIIDTCPNNQYISLNQYQCVSSCVGGYIDETKCVLKCTDKLVDVSSQRCVTQCGANQLQISGYCKCAEAYIAKDNQCECYSNGGYSIIDGMCKCDSSLGRVTMSNQCVCDSYRGLAISGSQNICSCNTDLGFKSGSSISNCLCDVDKGFVLEPQLEDQGFVCLCNSAKGYKLNPRSIKPTCIKENKSMPIIGGIIGGNLFLISLIILLLYYKKKKQQDNNNTNQKQNSQKEKQLKVKVPNKQERAPKILKLNQIQKNESISSVNKVQMMPIFQEQNNVQNYVDEQLIDNQSQYQQEKVNAVDAEQNIVSSPSEMMQANDGTFSQNAASTVLQSHFIDQSAQFDQIQLLQNEYISNNSSSRNQSGLSQKQQPGLKDNKKKFRRPEINAESFQGKKIDTQTIKNNIQLMQNRTKGLEPMKRSMKQVKMM